MDASLKDDPALLDLLIGLCRTTAARKRTKSETPELFGFSLRTLFLNEVTKNRSAGIGASVLLSL
jgi:hypothetical protein